MIGSGAVHPSIGANRAAPQVAAADHNRNLNTAIFYTLDDPGNPFCLRGIDSIIIVLREGLAAELKKNALILRGSWYRLGHKFLTFCKIKGIRAHSLIPFPARRLVRAAVLRASS